MWFRREFRFDNFLARHIDDEIEIGIEKKVNQREEEWEKCLKEMSVFTIKKIENHRIKSGKISSAIKKTTDHGEKFTEERCLFADYIFAANTERIFYVKGNVSINKKGNKINGGWHKQSKLWYYLCKMQLPCWRVRLL